MCEYCNNSSNEPHIVANQIRLPSGKIIRSHDRHDFVSVEEDGVTYMVDGGSDYLKRSLTGEECSVYSNDDFSVVRKYLAWGTYGKTGTEPFHRVSLDNMSNAHIKAVLETQHQVPRWRQVLMEKELMYRADNDILIED